jgi:hypothetical protein
MLIKRKEKEIGVVNFDSPGKFLGFYIGYYKIVVYWI